MSKQYNETRFRCSLRVLSLSRRARSPRTCINRHDRVTEQVAQRSERRHADQTATTAAALAAALRSRRERAFPVAIRREQRRIKRIRFECRRQPFAESEVRRRSARFHLHHVLDVTNRLATFRNVNACK